MNTTLNTHASIIINININIKLAHEIKKLRKDRTHLENDFGTQSGNRAEHFRGVMKCIQKTNYLLNSDKA